MGSWFSSVFDTMFAQPKKFNLMIVGLNNSGKTTILYKMKQAEVHETTPTIGHNIEEIKVKNVSIKAWDLSGQERMRNVWKHYYETVSGIVFVVDCADRERISDVNDELAKIVLDCPRTPLLILANKQDQPEAMRVEELT